MNVEAFYKERIEAIWADQIKEHPETSNDEIIRIGYAVERELPCQEVLFIGMNPAFKPGVDVEHGFFYDVNPPMNDFFKAIVNFNYDTLRHNTPSHHDLLFVRHTNQKDVEVLLKKGPFKDFLQKQIDLSKEIIRALSPKLIVVLNAGACKLFNSMFTRVSDEHIEKDIGAYAFEINQITPVLFSSMLSGQRALDIGSRNSLSWHIRFILDKLGIKC